MSNLVKAITDLFEYKNKSEAEKKILYNTEIESTMKIVGKFTVYRYVAFEEWDAYKLDKYGAVVGCEIAKIPLSKDVMNDIINLITQACNRIESVSK